VCVLGWKSPSLSLSVGSARSCIIEARPHGQADLCGEVLYLRLPHCRQRWRLGFLGQRLASCAWPWSQNSSSNSVCEFPLSIVLCGLLLKQSKWWTVWWLICSEINWLESTLVVWTCFVSPVYAPYWDCIYHQSWIASCFNTELQCYCLMIISIC
jgi:hypothetical protein